MIPRKRSWESAIREKKKSSCVRGWLVVDRNALVIGARSLDRATADVSAV